MVWTWGASRKDRNQKLGLVYIWKGELMGLARGLDVGCERMKNIKDDSESFIMSNYMNGSVIY